jgi:hypothetical protein
MEYGGEKSHKYLLLSPSSLTIVLKSSSTNKLFAHLVSAFLDNMIVAKFLLAALGLSAYAVAQDQDGQEQDDVVILDSWPMDPNNVQTQAGGPVTVCSSSPLSILLSRIFAEGYEDYDANHNDI